MNYYDKINWKNRSEGKTTKISAERLNHMDNQIFDNANAIGNVEKIADIGDGTLCGAAESLNGSISSLNQSLGNIKHFYMGTKVVQINSGNNSYGFLSTTEIENLLGVSSIDVAKLSVVVMNGDAAAFPSHFESVSYGNNTAYIVFKDKLTQDMKCRINYVIFYNG